MFTALDSMGKVSLMMDLISQRQRIEVKVNKERTPTSDALSSPINICPLNQ